MSLNGKYTDLLVQLLAIPALSRSEETRASFLEKWLLAEGLKVKRIANNLVVTHGGNPSAAWLLLNSHIDTVAPTAGWDSDPYLPVRTDTRITGLGSNDAGASVVSLLAAFSLLSDSAHANEVVLVLSAEEEVSGSNGISAVLPLLDGLRFAIIGEPTGMQPAVAERGLMVIDAKAAGKSGHAARGEGENAIYKAVRDIALIEEMKFTDHSEWLGDPSVNVTMINAGTNHNVVPAACDFVIDVRSNDRYSNERLLELLREKCTSILTPRSMRLRSSFLEKKHLLFDLLEEMKLKPFGSPTLSDMAILDIPAVKIGPGDSARSHTANEYILTGEIGDAVSIYTQLIEKLIKLNT